MKKLSLISLLIATVTVLALLASCGSTETDTPATTAASGEQTEVTEAAADLASYYNFEKETYEGTDYYVLKSVTEEGKKQKKLEVPEKYEGLDVQVIEEEAFAGCTELETVIFHSTVLELYANLFPDSTKLTKIYLDFGALAEKTKTDENYLLDNTDVALASDGSVTGTNSFIEGLDTDKVKLIFTDSYAYDIYRVEYRWGVFAGIMELEK